MSGGERRLVTGRPTSPPDAWDLDLCLRRRHDTTSGFVQVWPWKPGATKGPTVVWGFEEPTGAALRPSQAAPWLMLVVAGWERCMRDNRFPEWM